MKGGHYISPSGKVVLEIRKIREGLSYKFMGNYTVDTGKRYQTVARKLIEKKLKNWTKLEMRKFRRKTKKTKSNERNLRACSKRFPKETEVHEMNRRKKNVKHSRKSKQN